MESLSSYLKSARLGKNVSLEQMAGDTRISLRHLKSLEEGHYGDLPGGMYNRAFLRSYCEYLGLDAGESLARYAVETSPPKEKGGKAKSGVSQLGPAFHPSPLLIWSVMLAISVAGLYFSRNWIGAVFSPYFSSPPAPPQVAGESKPNPPPPPPAAVQAPANTAADTAQKPAENALTALSREVGSEAAPAEGTSAASKEPGALRLELQVLRKCWVMVSSDGSRVLEKELEPGEDHSFKASERFFLIVGNAGGIRLKINGLPIRPLGKEGAVVRLEINEQNIRNLTGESSG